MSKDDDILTEAEAKRLIKGGASADPMKRAKPQKGDKGERGKDGADGRDGVDGKDGKNGKDGILATKALDDLKPDEEVKTLQVEVVVVKGKDGKDGKDGRDGKDGARGEKGDPGRNGKDGGAGKDGRDGTDGKNGRGVPKGGRRNQVLKKNSDEDFDTYWGDEPQPGGGIVVQGGGGSGNVETVTGLDTDNSDPANPVIRIATDSTIIGSGTPDDPLSVPAEPVIVSWGDIVGTLSDQADLQAALDAKLDDSMLDTDGTLAANSDTRISSQKAVKTYADQLIGAANAIVFKGVIDCSANPNYPSADAGWLYRVSVAGKIGGASGPNVEVGDTLLCLVDGSPAGNHATVGANWNISQANIDGAVIGPTSATDNAIALFNGTTGKIIKDSQVIIDTDPALAADSDQRIATQKAVKAYVDAIAAGFDVQIIDVTGEWTKPVGCTGDCRVRVILIPGGGGGGAGRRGPANNNRFGGGSGGGGRATVQDYIADQLGATEDVVIGTGGPGAAGVAVDTTSGSAGTSGGDSLFGGLTAATAKQQASGGAGGPGGGPTGGVAPTGNSEFTLQQQFFPALPVLTSNTTGTIGTRSSYGPAAGSGGGGLNTSNTNAAGGLGGSARNAYYSTSNTLGVAGGTSGGGAGNPGQDGDDWDVSPFIFGGGGSGGGSNAAGAGGDGGDGGFPGGGGGGGGASVNGSVSGGGGDGADGRCIVISETRGA